MQFVLDCSVAISWCLVDENNDYANSILAMMVDSQSICTRNLVARDC